MCGICGFINYKGKNSQEVLRRMTDILIHRGPDDSGMTLLDNGTVGLGHRRLSIIDLTERGRQPMTNEDGTVWLTYNGEIYNFKEIRNTLEAKGHRFISDTDTEVIIHAYEEWGIDCINKFCGMFSFGLWDARQKSLFLVRDRLGIKPLYYTFIDGAIAFASEIKSLLMLPDVNKELDLQNISNYLMFLWAPKDITPFKNIFKLAPGEYLIYTANTTKKVKYWDVEFNAFLSDENSSISRILETLTDSVKKRLISDVPLGAFLSGGVDSSLILALMRRTGKKDIITYTVGFGSQQLKHDICPDDVYYSRIARDSIGGLNYNEIMLEADVAGLWPKIVWHLDEPIGDPAALSTYLICKSAKSKATVMLSGMGAEEIFAGYSRYLATRLSSRYQRLPGLLRKKLLSPALMMLPASGKRGSFPLFRNIKKFIKNADSEFPKNYLGYFAYYSKAQLDALTNNSDYFENITDMFMHEYFSKVTGADYLTQVLYTDQKTFLPSLNLTYTDKASMAASVEVRVPLLDHEFVGLAANTPSQLKIKGNRQKYIFKKAAQSLLPKEIVWRKKAGFGAPVRAWVKNEKVKEMIYDLLSPQAVKRRGIFDYSQVERILKDDASGREDNALKIWQLLTLEIWFNTFMDNDGSRALS